MFLCFNKTELNKKMFDSYLFFNISKKKDFFPKKKIFFGKFQDFIKKNIATLCLTDKTLTFKNATEAKIVSRGLH